MTIRVHGYPISTATRRVLLCLFEQNLEFEFINVDLTKGDQKTPQYLSLQPFGKIPVLEDSDNNATLFESRAIGRYILSTGYAKQQTLLPASASPTQRAMIETWSAVEQSEFDPPASAISYEKVAKKVYGFGDADIGVIQYNREKLRNVFAVYEKRLGEQNYLAGEEFSMADLFHMPMMSRLENTGDLDLLDDKPNVRNWWERLKARDSWTKIIAFNG